MQKDNEKGAIIGYVNRGACREMGIGKGVKVPLVLPCSMLDYLADRYPYDYLSRIEFLSKAAGNQVAFHLNENGAVLFCLFAKNEGGIRAVLFKVGFDGIVETANTTDDLTCLTGEWKFVKASARRDYPKHRAR